MQSTREKFFNGSEIRYRCWGREGGFVYARWSGAWQHRHESDEAFTATQMSEARARYFFPTDAMLVGA